MTLLRRKSVTAWLALAVMALNALWPLLANAKPSLASHSSAICSANGLKQEGGPAQPPDNSVKPSHCKLCPAGAERDLALATAAVLASVAPVQGFAPAILAESRRPAALELTAPPRAPPAHF